jgi:hypothetical protein
MALDVSRVIVGAHDEPILCIAFNKQRRELYSGAQDGLVKVQSRATFHNPGIPNPIVSQPVDYNLQPSTLDSQPRTPNPEP